VTREEKLAYSRGYNAGRKGVWPEHRPPMPPDETCRKVLEALRALRDGVDSELAKFDEHDEICMVLGPLIAQVDDVFEEIGDWLKETVP
jgi:hypothetical protein